jgi:hypothetical protein
MTRARGVVDGSLRVIAVGQVVLGAVFLSVGALSIFVDLFIQNEGKFIVGAAVFTVTAVGIYPYGSYAGTQARVFSAFAALAGLGYMISGV